MFRSLHLPLLHCFMDRRALSFFLGAVTILLIWRLSHDSISERWSWSTSSSRPSNATSPSSSMTEHHSSLVHQEATTTTLGPKKKRRLKVAIAESMGWHDEVYAAYVHAFLSQRPEDVELGLFFKEPRWGMPNLLKTFDNLPLSLPEYVYYDINALNLIEPDIIVSVSCEYDLRELVKRLDFLFERKKTYLFCTAHYANLWDEHHEWIEPALTKWIEAGLVTVVTLSPHVQDGFHKPDWGLSSWRSLKGNRDEGGNDTSTPIPLPPVEVFVPVFPPSNVSASRQEDENEGVSFAIQGGVTDNRDYSRVMNYLADLQRSSNSISDVSLHIIGSGGWEDFVHESVPNSVQNQIFFDSNLDYLDYYSYLAAKSALIPAFSKDDYLETISSSSIPASLIGGIPLVATRAMLKSYSYLREEDVYVQEDGETELDAIRRVVQLSDEERRAKTKTVHVMRERMVKRNVKMVGGWIEDVRLKMGW